VKTDNQQARGNAENNRPNYTNNRPKYAIILWAAQFALNEVIHTLYNYNAAEIMLFILCYMKLLFDNDWEWDGRFQCIEHKQIYSAKCCR